MKLALNDQDPRLGWPVEGMTGVTPSFFSINPMDGKGQGEEAAEGGNSSGGAAPLGPSAFKGEPGEGRSR